MPKLLSRQEAACHLDLLREAAETHPAGTWGGDSARRQLAEFDTRYRVIGGRAQIDSHLPRGNGNGSSARRPHGASDASLAFLDRLTAERGLTTDELLRAVCGKTRSQLAEDQRLTSKAIDTIKALPRLPKPDDLVRPAPQRAAPQITDGYYVLDGDIVMVQHNRAHTRFYAKRLVVDEGHGSFIWEPGLINKMGDARPMSEQDAKQFGDLYGECFKCHAELTREESKARGCGPTCAKTMGW